MDEACNKSPIQTKLLAEIRQKPSLLGRLRQQLVEVNPSKEEEVRQKMKLIIEHQSKFPLKLRGAIRIAEASGKEDPAIFLSDVYDAVKDFFFGRFHHNGGIDSGIESDSDSDSDNDSDSDSDSDEEQVPELVQRSELESDSESESESESPYYLRWHGLDSDVDTEEEAEITIRFFPKILTEYYGCYPIFVLFKCSKAMSFVPLLAELGVELGRFNKGERGGLTADRNIFYRVVCNNVIRDKLDEETSAKVDETSTAILARLKEKGLMEENDIYRFRLIEYLLLQENYKNTLPIDNMFESLINWCPSILMDTGHGGTLLYQNASTTFYRRNNTLRRFQSIFDLGMYHYPTELGFMFHKSRRRLHCESIGYDLSRMFDIDDRHDDDLLSTLELSCEVFGTINIARIIHEKVVSTLEQDNHVTMQDLVFAAASNDEISLDGVYTLLRLDPIAVLPQSPDTL